MAEDLATRPRAVIFGCGGPALTEPERAFFAEADPLGFILFARNCENPDQVRALVAELLDTVGRADAPVLIDQEGGRVQRLKPPHWRDAPAAGVFAELAEDDPIRAEEAARLNARLIAADLAALGITVDCAPVLDVPQPGADDIIGDRAVGRTPDLAARLGRAVCEGLMAGGVLPVIKHIPGHGRAVVDSHKSVPIVDASRDQLDAFDFAPFRALCGMPWSMTAHVVYTAIDPDRPATTSPCILGEVIRVDIGFRGVLVSDDLSMQALTGGLGERAAAARAAGCDVALHCNGDMAEMADIADNVGSLTNATEERLGAAELQRRRSDDKCSDWDRDAALLRLAVLMGAS